MIIAGDRATPKGRLSSPNDASRIWLRWPAKDLTVRIAMSGVPILNDNHAPVDRLMRSVLDQRESVP